MTQQIPESWAACEIGDVAKVVGGATPPSKDPSNFVEDDGIPWITPADLSGYKHMYIDRGARNLSEKGFQICSAALMPPGTVLFSSRAPIGYVAIASNSVSTNQGFKSFVLPEGIESRFVYYYLRYIRDIAEARATGTTFKELSGAAASRLPLIIPPTNEQKRIADKLDAVLARVDACRERLDRVPGILKRFRQAVLAAATSGVLTEGWRGNRRIDTWTTERAINVCAKVQSGGTPKEGFVDVPGIPFLKVYNIVGQKVAFKYRPQYVTVDAHAGALTKSQTLPGDVLMNIVGPPLGKVAIVPDTFKEWNINQAITLFRPDARISTKWIYIVLCSGMNIAAVVHETRGSAGQVNISLSQCRDFEFPVPTLAEQAEISDRVDSLFAYADHLESRYTAARAHIDRLTPSLLAKAFRGELVPQDPNDEPASHLLERISATRSAPGATRSPKKQRRPNATAPTSPNSPKSEPTDVSEAQLSIFVPEQNQTNGGVIPEENLLAALRTSVRGERSGLTESELLRGAASRLGFERLGKNIRTVLEHTLSTALNRRVVVLEEDRYVAATPTIARYDDTFLLASLAAIMRSDYEYKPDDIAEMMAGYLGYSAVTDAMRERIDGVVAEGLRVGVLAGKGGWVWRVE